MSQEIRAVVEEVLMEREKSAAHRFVRRSPSRHVDPEGRTWYSGAVSKAQVAMAVCGLIASVFSAVWAGMEVRDRLTVYPHVGVMIDERLGKHEVEARREMESLAPRFATAAELASVRQSTAVDLATQSTQLLAIKEQLDRIEQRLARSGR